MKLFIGAKQITPKLNQNRALFNYLSAKVNWVENSYKKIVPLGAQKYASIKKYKGKCLIFNQLYQNGNFQSKSGWRADDATISVNNNICTVTSTATVCALNTSNNIGNKHKYYYSVFVKPSNTSMQLRISNAYGGGDVLASKNTLWQRLETIWTTTISNTASVKYPQVYASGINSGETFEVKNAMLIDLTKMFGAGNEPSTVAQVKAMFPDDYYDYNTGEFVCAAITSIVSKKSNATLVDTFNIPSTVQQLDGYGVSVGSVENELDLVNKKFNKGAVKVDLSTLNWTYGWDRAWFTDEIVNGKTAINYTVNANIFAENYPVGNPINDTTSCINYFISSGSKRLAVYNQSSTETPTGILCYELEEPVEIDISDIFDTDHLIEVEELGTIEFVNGENLSIPIYNEGEFII